MRLFLCGLCSWLCHFYCSCTSQSRGFCVWWVSLGHASYLSLLCLSSFRFQFIGCYLDVMLHVDESTSHMSALLWVVCLTVEIHHQVTLIRQSNTDTCTCSFTLLCGKVLDGQQRLNFTSAASSFMDRCGFTHRHMCLPVSHFDYTQW